MHNDEKNFCRVCGYNLGYPIWGEDGETPSYEICPCCGVQFGYGDTSLENCIDIRKHWIENEKCKWFSPKLKPQDWDLRAQLEKIPEDFK